jgi:hypothetical protein
MILSILPFCEFRKDERDNDEHTKYQDVLEDGTHVKAPFADKDKVCDQYCNTNEEIDNTGFWTESRSASPAGNDTVPDLCERGGYSDIEGEVAAFRATPSLFLFFPE